MNVLRKILFVVTAIICVFITLRNTGNGELNVYGTPYVIGEYADTYYEMLSDNVGITTINGISNVYYNMGVDGYDIYNEEITNDYIDVSFIKDEEPSYRFYYEHPEGRVTIFCSDYENSFSGVAYITVKKEKDVTQ